MIIEYTAKYGNLNATATIEVINQLNNSNYDIRFYISGKAKVGNIIYLRNGKESSDNTQYNYQWQRSDSNDNWSNIDNANENQYTLDTIDLMRKIRVKISFIINGENKTVIIPNNNNTDSLLVLDADRIY